MGEMNRWTDQEADRLSRIMVNDPHFAAEEMRQQLQQLDPQSASVLIAKTKNMEIPGGLGDLQIQVEMDNNGCDTGFRNVTMATPDGVEQIAEIQSGRGASCPQPQANDRYDPAYDQSYDPNYGSYQGAYRPRQIDPFAIVAGVIVGDLLWQQRRGNDFSDGRYRDWCDRERFREGMYRDHRDEFRQNWQNPEYRHHWQSQNWHDNAWRPQNNYFNAIINNQIFNNFGGHNRDQDRNQHRTPVDGRPIWQQGGQQLPRHNDQDHRRYPNDGQQGQNWQRDGQNWQRNGQDWQRQHRNGNGEGQIHQQQGVDQNALRMQQVQQDRARQAEISKQQIEAAQQQRRAAVNAQHDQILQQQQQRQHAQPGVNPALNWQQQHQQPQQDQGGHDHRRRDNR